MGMLNKLFKSDKKYYLELDAVQDKAAEVADAAQDKAAEVAESQPVQEAVETGKQVIDEAQEKLQSATEVESQPEKKAAQAKSGQSQKGTSKKAAKDSGKKTSAPSAASLKSSGTSAYEPPFWVAAMYKTNNSSSGENNSNVQAEQTFATDNLMPTITKYRRRPGPSLNKFRDMASKARTPRR